MVMVVVIEFGGMRCQPLRRALVALIRAMVSFNL
ncbi:acetyltransferase [Vibrio cholerae]|nr:acetyltransferase [Vibrio cholerae]